ncbi:MAG: SPFH domain-containing protein [Acidilobaceae archaeon]
MLAETLGFLIVLLIVLAILIATYSIRVVREYERLVVFRLGRLLGTKGPGLVVLIPIVDTAVKVDLRIVAVDVPEQRVITRDNVTVGVDAVVYYRVVEPDKAVTKIENYHYAIMMLAQTSLRDIVGQLELDDLLTKREEVNRRLQETLDILTDPWGIKVVSVTLKEVRLPEGMLRAMAKQAEAERWRRARVIEAEGEKQAAAIMAEAARIYEEHPVAVRLRELQTLVEIAREKNMIVIAPSGVLGTVAGLEIALSKAQTYAAEEKRGEA